MIAPVVVDRDLVEDLVQRAATFIAAHYRQERHQIGAVLIDADGGYHYGLHLEAMIGRASTCAEAAALANAIMSGARGGSIIVAVRHPKPSEPHTEPKVVPPCGLCRELLLDYLPNVLVVIDTDQGHQAMRLADLIPHKYVGTKWNHEAMDWAFAGHHPDGGTDA